MKRIDPIEIVVLKDPQPEAKEATPLKKAWSGLRLKADLLLEAGSSEKYPQGTYMIPLNVVMRAMASHNERAYQCLVAYWGDVKNALEENEIPSPILLPFPLDCCEVIK